MKSKALPQPLPSQINYKRLHKTHYLVRYECSCISFHWRHNFQRLMFFQNFAHLVDSLGLDAAPWLISMMTSSAKLQKRIATLHNSWLFWFECSSIALFNDYSQFDVTAKPHSFAVLFACHGVGAVQQHFQMQAAAAMRYARIFVQVTKCFVKDTLTTSRKSRNAAPYRVQLHCSFQWERPVQSQQGHENFQESIFMESKCKHYLHRPACWHWLFIRLVLCISPSHIVRQPAQNDHLHLKPADERSFPSSAIMLGLAERISCGTNRAFCADMFCKNPPRAHH